MNKHGEKRKILRNLGDGYTIKETRKYNEETKHKKTIKTLVGSDIGLWFGKKLVQGKFKNLQEALTYFTK